MIHRARPRHDECTITTDDILKVWPYDNKCPVFGTELRRAKGVTSCRKSSPSLDRIDSSRGYTPDNIQILSDLANKMKQNATLGELQLFAEWINNDCIKKSLKDRYDTRRSVSYTHLTLPTILLV